MKKPKKFEPVEIFVTDTGQFEVQKATRKQLLEVIAWMKPRLYKRYRGAP